MEMDWTLAIMRNGFAHALIRYYTKPSTYECIKETERVLEYFERDENINQDIRLVAYNYMKINGGRWGSKKEYEALKKDYNFVGTLVSTDAPKSTIYVIPENVGAIFCDNEFNAYIDFDNDKIGLNVLNIAHSFNNICKMSGWDSHSITPYHTDKNYMDFSFWHSEDMVGLYKKYDIIYNGTFFYSLKT